MAADSALRTPLPMVTGKYQGDEDEHLWMTLYNPDFGIVSSSAFASPTKVGQDDQDMWTSIYNLLNKKPDDRPKEHDDESVEVPKAKRIRVYTNKAEVQQLEAEISELQAQLIQVKRAVESRTDLSMWEAAAKQQRVEKNKSIQENQLLQHAIRERNEYIERLQKTILKTPRWTALPDITPDDVSRVIPADPALRLAAFHRIADSQYSQLQTKFIQAGAFDLREDMCKGEPITLAHQELGFQAVNHIHIPAPFNVVARAVWSVMRGLHAPIPSKHEQESWEQVDENTVYNKYCVVQNGVTCHSNSIRKIYEEPNRIAIISATILEDETVTRHPSDAIDDMNAWWQCVPKADDPSSCYMTIVGQSNISRLVEFKDLKANADEVVATLQGLMSKIHKLGEVKAPSYLMPFIKRRRRLRIPMQKVMETVIGDHAMRAKFLGLKVTEE
ncbi:unnamed protein product [Aphanomyces euteiches]|uniref:START domain-containing protein n=1 Tax=Aphanomyces euteiches TaxID=100861 RepID=A0A6G0X7N1_9STRA|nr:hypothetical protein Ae201684_007606 [Aphanomyces euteiches]KAH9067407.1 hypothetical protein Ae201684P_021566 [Aphanomyces euteiches]